MTGTLQGLLNSIQELGVNGPSWFAMAPEIDMIEGMSSDDMQCVLLGMCRLLLHLWTKSGHHQEPWYIGNMTDDIDCRLESITPPDEVQCTPRSISSTIKFCKGVYTQ